MEVTTALLVGVLSLTPILILRWLLERREHFRFFKKHCIPGPEPSIITGNMPRGKAVFCIHTISKWHKEYGDTFGFFLGRMPFIFIKDLQMLKQIFVKDFHVFHDRPPCFLDFYPMNESIADIKGQRWREVRSILSSGFSTGKIKLMVDIVTKKADTTVTVISQKKMFDMYEVAHAFALDVIADCALALKTRCQQDEKDSFLLAVKEFFRFQRNPAIDLATMFPFIASAMVFINDHLMKCGKATVLIVDNVRAVIKARKDDQELKSNDLLQLMINNNEKNSTEGGYVMSDNEIVANAWAYLMAGFETTSLSISFTFHLLVTHPEVQERLFQEINTVNDASYTTIQSLVYLNQVLSESLRMFPPAVGFTTRSCDQDYWIGSLMIPKGANVFAPVWDIHHDPELWSDPWTFDPERFSPDNKASLNKTAHMPFGIGPRNCVGERFALLEVKTVIFKLLKKFKFVPCEKTEDPLTLSNKPFAIFPVKGVWMQAIPRC